MTKYLVVGAGLFGATFAREAALRGHQVHVIEKDDHIAGHIHMITITLMINIKVFLLVVIPKLRLRC